jgi:hypothetical protein
LPTLVYKCKKNTFEEAEYRFNVFSDSDIITTYNYIKVHLYPVNLRKISLNIALSNDPCTVDKGYIMF